MVTPSFLRYIVLLSIFVSCQWSAEDKKAALDEARAQLLKEAYPWVYAQIFDNTSGQRKIPVSGKVVKVTTTTTTTTKTTEAVMWLPLGIDPRLFRNHVAYLVSAEDKFLAKGKVTGFTDDGLTTAFDSGVVIELGGKIHISLE
jgi:hypothetical protein